MSNCVPEQGKRDNRSHSQVIRDAGPRRIVEFLVGRGFEEVRLSAVHNWASRGSIPGSYWNALEEGGFATLKELATHAETQKVGQSQFDGACAAE